MAAAGRSGGGGGVLQLRHLGGFNLGLVKIHLIKSGT